MSILKHMLAAAVGAAALAGLSASASAQTIGFSQVGSESDWRTAFSADMKAEAEKRGIKLQFSDAQQKEENQLKAVRSFIAQKVDAIIIAPVVVTGWDQVLKEAQAAKIPVFIADRAVESAPSARLRPSSARKVSRRSSRSSRT